jgi:hypothetical protein
LLSASDWLVLAAARQFLPHPLFLGQLSLWDSHLKKTPPFDEELNDLLMEVISQNLELMLSVSPKPQGKEMESTKKCRRSKRDGPSLVEVGA